VLDRLPLVALTATVGACARQKPAARLVTCPAPDQIEVPPGGEVYVRGQGCLWSESLILDANGNFSRSCIGCTGGSQSKGPVERSDGRLVLHDPRAPNSPCADGVRALDPFLVVRWGERRYLVPEDMAIGFCDDVNNRIEPRAVERGGYYFLRQGDHLLPAGGRPELPPELSRLVLDHVVESTTAQSGPRGTAWLSVGSDSGLSAEMELMLHDLPTDPKWIAEGAGPFCDFQPLAIVELEARRCRVAYKWGHATRPAIPMSMRVTTGTELAASR
jgi:hypothetical protein